MRQKWRAFRILHNISIMISVYTFINNDENNNIFHWGRATYICVGKLTIIGSDNGVSPGRRQAIIWTIAGILFIESLGTNFSEILIRIETFSFTKKHLKMSSAKWRPFVSASMWWCTILLLSPYKINIITSEFYPWPGGGLFSKYRPRAFKWMNSLRTP